MMKKCFFLLFGFTIIIFEGDKDDELPLVIAQTDKNFMTISMNRRHVDITKY